PLITQVLIGFSDFVVATWWMIGLGLAVAVVGLRQWVRTAAGRLTWDRIKLRIPIAGKIVLKASLARFARSFSLAVRSGVPIVQSLTLVAQTVDNAYLATQIESMRTGVERGESVLRTAANSGVFTPVVLQMIMVGEESGALDDMMEEIADMYQRDVEYELKTLSAQIEPVLIILLGLLVLFLALGVFLPIWDLGAAALKK
ncbi:MAG: type II secretion system F family protein, partial [Burkholderiales bacterium]